MLSCLMPRFGQEDKVMPSSAAAFPLFPSLTSGLSSKDIEGTSHAEYLIKCPQCHQEVMGFQALKEHIFTVHPLKKEDMHEPNNYHSQPNNHHYDYQHSQNASASSSPLSFAHQHNPHHLPSPISLNATVAHQHILNGHMDDMKYSQRSPSPSTSSEGPHACSQCSASFQNRDLLDKHELLHSPNSNVQCKICNKTFANVYRLQRHMISHDESALLRKFKCTDCDKAFKFKHHLKEHVRIHSGEKPFKCNNCGKRFSHSGSYSSHMTSKKCISMGLKLNRSLKLDNMKINLSQKRLSTSSMSIGANGPLVSSPYNGIQSLQHNTSHMSSSNNNNNNSGTSPNNNPFLPMLPKYSNYDALNAAFFASIQNLPNPFFPSMGPLDPRTQPPISPYSIQRLLAMDLFTKTTNSNHVSSIDSEHSNNKTPSLHSDPEDMIEEVTEDLGNDEPNKLVMDLDEDDEDEKRYEENKSSNPPSPSLPVQADAAIPQTNVSKSYNAILNAATSMTQQILEARLRNTESPFASISSEMDDRHIKQEHSRETEVIEPDKILKCSRCDMQFNHCTELAQHEKVLCGMYSKQSISFPVSGYLPAQSGSDDDCEETTKQSSSDAERKVRVRTALSEEQQIILKEHYSINSRPSREEFRIIAQRLALDPRVVQVWFQNNRSRERKLNNIGYMKQPIVMQSPMNGSISPPIEVVGPSIVNTKPTTSDDQPLDLSVKKISNSNSNSTSSNSPRYGTAPLQNDTTDSGVMNLSCKSSWSPTPYRSFHLYGTAAARFSAENIIRQTPSPNEAVPRYSPYIMPTSTALGMMPIPMERLLQMTPEMARNPLLGLKTESLSPGSEKRSWKGDGESRSSYDDGHLHNFPYKRPNLKHETESDGQFICDQCEKAFNKQSSLARHKYEHSGQRPYKCIECPKAFKHKHHLTEHKRLHTGEKPFKCEKCFKRFSHSGSFSQHMNHRYSYCKPYRE